MFIEFKEYDALEKAYYYIDKNITYLIRSYPIEETKQELAELKATNRWIVKRLMELEGK